MPHRVCGPGQNRCHEFSTGGLHVCAGAWHSESLYLIHNMNSICIWCKLIITIFRQIPIICSQFPT